MLQLHPYDGTTDLLDHLESYKALIQIQETIDALLYITFQLLFVRRSMHDTLNSSREALTLSSSKRSDS